MAVAGARYHTGYDHAMYLHQYTIYQKYGFFTREFEPLFMWVTQLMSGAHVHYFFYFAFWAGVQFLFCIYSCKHNKRLLPWLCLNIVLGPFWIYLMNSMREGVVASLFLSMLPLIVYRKFWFYALITFIAVGIHKSALLMIPLYFIGFIDLKPSRRASLLLLVLLAGFIAIGTNPFWLKSILRIFVSLNLLSDQYLTIAEPMMNGQFKESNWGLISIIALSLNIITICIYPKLRAYFEHDKILPVVFVMFIAYCCCYYAFANTHHLFLRPFDLLMFSKVLIFAYVALYFFENRKWLLLMLFSLLNYSLVYLSIAKAIAIPTKVNQQILYHFFFI